MTATVLLVRHCTHEHQGVRLVGRMDDVALGPDGARELAWLRARFAREDLAAVWSSPIARARETAAAAAAGRDVVIDAALTEVDFGRWTGWSMERLDDDPEWRAWNGSKSTFRVPGGETVLEVQARMVDAVDRARRAHAGGTVAMVSHGDPIKSVVAYHLGAPVSRIDDFEVGHPSVTGLVVGDWGAKVLFVNETIPPLRGEGQTRETGQGGD